MLRPLNGAVGLLNWVWSPKWGCGTPKRDWDPYMGLWDLEMGLWDPQVGLWNP